MVSAHAALAGATEEAQPPLVRSRMDRGGRSLWGRGRPWPPTVGPRTGAGTPRRRRATSVRSGSRATSHSRSPTSARPNARQGAPTGRHAFFFPACSGSRLVSRHFGSAFSRIFEGDTASRRGLEESSRSRETLRTVRARGSFSWIVRSLVTSRNEDQRDQVCIEAVCTGVRFTGRAKVPGSRTFDVIMRLCVNEGSS